MGKSTHENVLKNTWKNGLLIRNLFRDKPCSMFKPGQTSLDRDYYAAATTAKPDGTACLQNYQRFGSDYANKLAGTVKHGDYKVPSKDANTLGKEWTRS